MLNLSYLISKSKPVLLKNRLPFFISIETANYCNLHCPQCPVGIGKYIQNTDKHVFDFELYKKIINELKPTLCHVILYFQGEPLINKQLPDFVRYAHERKIFTSTSTNGQLINKNNAKLIVSSGLDKLIVSIDGTTQSVYESYRVGGNLQKAIEGIRLLVDVKKKLKSFTPLIEIQFIVLKTNEHQMNEMRKLAKELRVNRLRFKTAQLYDFENGHPLIPEKLKYSRYKQQKNGIYTVKTKQPNHCWRLWNGAVINTSGEVLPCCFDKGSEFSFGNINTSLFSNIWHDTKSNNFRSELLQNRLQFEMCRNCNSQ
jgi:radical SAM protein with 4Fe4S-binding SPASM domain